MKKGREEGRKDYRRAPIAFLIAVMFGAMACTPSSPPAREESPESPSSKGSKPENRHGGRLVVALASEPKTLNPVMVSDLSSRAVTHRIMADLIHIDRESQQAEPALAESWKISADGQRYTLQLRRGLQFSDGHLADADDVLFSFRVYLDEEIASPERHQLLIGDAPLAVRKLDSRTVEFELPEPYAAAERLFDGFAILPRHVLEETYEAGRLADAWGLSTPAEDIVGMGPFRLREYQPGERLILERNPHYWKQDDEGQKLPYLDEIVFLLNSAPEAQTLRLLGGELDVVDRLDPEDFSSLARQATDRGLQLFDLGPGLDYNFLFFNLNDLDGKSLPEVMRKQRWFHQVGFRQAILAAIDLEAMARLVFQGRATPLASFVTPGNKLWLNEALKPPRRSLAHARRLLKEQGFSWDAEGRLVDTEGQRVEFSILTVASSPKRMRMASMIQEDLRPLGLDVRLTSLELGAVLERLTKSYDYEACILGLGGGGLSPNRMMNVLLSNGSHHLWRLSGDAAETPWQEEIDRLMQQQLTALDPGERKRLYDRVQQIVAEKLPMISLVSPNVLVASQQGLGNFRPAILSHPTLWNAEELFWHPGN